MTPDRRGTPALKSTGLLERFAPVLRGLRGPVQLNGELEKALTIEAEGSLRVVWAPFDHVAKQARLVLVGITPGRHQAESALLSFRDALAEGLGVEDALRQVKAAASFSGPLRANLVAVLDHIGLHNALGVGSCSEFFGAGNTLVHFTSALRYPVFVNGQNYSGTPDFLRTKMLKEWVDNTLASEVRLLRNALWVPLGPKPATALHHLAEQGIINPLNILGGLPHPSGANAERVAFFLGRKARADLSRNTTAEPIEAARERLCDQVARLLIERS